MAAQFKERPYPIKELTIEDLRYLNNCATPFCLNRTHIRNWGIAATYYYHYEHGNRYNLMMDLADQHFMQYETIKHTIQSRVEFKSLKKLPKEILAEMISLSKEIVDKIDMYCPKQVQYYIPSGKRQLKKVI